MSVHILCAIVAPRELALSCGEGLDGVHGDTVIRDCRVCQCVLVAHVSASSVGDGLACQQPCCWVCRVLCDTLAGDHMCC